MIKNKINLKSRTFAISVMAILLLGVVVADISLGEDISIEGHDIKLTASEEIKYDLGESIQKFEGSRAYLINQNFQVYFPDATTSCEIGGECETEFIIETNKPITIDKSELIKFKTNKSISYDLYEGELKTGKHIEEQLVEGDGLRCPNSISPEATIDEDCMLTAQIEYGVICDRVRDGYCYVDELKEVEVDGEYWDWDRVLFSTKVSGKKRFKLVYPLKEKIQKYDVVIKDGFQTHVLDPVASSFSWNDYENLYFIVSNATGECSTVSSTKNHTFWGNPVLNDSVYLVNYDSNLPRHLSFLVTQEFNGTGLNYTLEYLRAGANSLLSGGVWIPLNITADTCGDFNSTGTCNIEFDMDNFPAVMGRDSRYTHYVNSTTTVTELFQDCANDAYRGMGFRLRLVNYTTWVTPPKVTLVKGGNNKMTLTCPQNEPCDFEDVKWYVDNYETEIEVESMGNTYQFPFRIDNRGYFNTSDEIAYIGDWDSYAPFYGYGYFTCGKIMHNEKPYAGSDIYGRSLTIYTTGWGWSANTKHYDCEFQKVEFNSTWTSVTGQTYNYLSGVSIGSSYIGTPGIGAGGGISLWKDMKAYSEGSITNIMTAEVPSASNVQIFSPSVGTAFYLYNRDVEFREPQVEEISSSGQYYNIYQTTISPTFNFINMNPPSPKQGVSTQKSVLRSGATLPSNTDVYVFFYDDSEGTTQDMSSTCAGGVYCNMTNNTIPESGDMLILADFNAGATCTNTIGNVFDFDMVQTNDANTYWQVYSNGNVWRDIDVYRDTYDLTRSNYSIPGSPSLTHSNESNLYFGLMRSYAADVTPYSDTFGYGEGCFYRLVWNGTASNTIEGSVQNTASYVPGISDWVIGEAYSFDLQVLDNNNDPMNDVTITLEDKDGDSIFQKNTGMVDESSHYEFYSGSVSNGNTITLDRQPTSKAIMDFVVSSFSQTGTYPHIEITGYDEFGLLNEEKINIGQDATYTFGTKYQNISEIDVVGFSADVEINMDGRLYEEIVQGRKLYYEPIQGDSTYNVVDEDQGPFVLTLSKTGYEDKEFTIFINKPYDLVVGMNPPYTPTGVGDGGRVTIRGGVGLG